MSVQHPHRSTTPKRNRVCAAWVNTKWVHFFALFTVTAALSVTALPALPLTYTLLGSTGAAALVSFFIR